LIEQEAENPQPQDKPFEIKSAPKIFKEMCEINWDQPAEKVRDFIRGLSPYPAAWTKINDLIYRIFTVEVVSEVKTKLHPGIYETDNKSYLIFCTQDKALRILELQAPGKKRMRTINFLRGNKL
jgi:methionyl-tRNA formyltransferase